jgi:hypothetical protein
LCESKGSRKRRLGLKELEQFVFVNKVMNGSRKKEELLVGRRMLYKARV